jgi:hypothetical protein
LSETPFYSGSRLLPAKPGLPQANALAGHAPRPPGKPYSNSKAKVKAYNECSKNHLEKRKRAMNQALSPYTAILDLIDGGC